MTLTASEFLWTTLLPAKAYQEQKTSITKGVDGSVYIVGSTQTGLDGEASKGNLDVFISKYSASGARVWTRIIGTGSDDAGFSVAVQGNNVFVAGSTRGGLDGTTNTGLSDAFITSYSTDGVGQWTKLLGTGQSETAYAITTSSDGSVFVAGSTGGNLDNQVNNGTDAFVSKISADGTKLWTRLIGSGNADGANAITSGADGSVYVAGYLRGVLNGGSEYGAFLTKYDANGNLAWSKVIGTFNGRSYEEGYGLATSADGSVYLVGSADFNNSTLLSDASGNGAFITKFLSSGDQVWTKYISTSGFDSALGKL